MKVFDPLYPLTAEVSPRGKCICSLYVMRSAISLLHLTFYLFRVAARSSALGREA